jgi:aminoglycoside phosphotransferase
MAPSNTALAPATIGGIVESSPFVRQLGMAVLGCQIRKVRNRNDGCLEVEYRLKLVRASTTDKFKVTLLGKFYPDDRGEHEYARLRERWSDADARVPDPRLSSFACYVPELHLLLHPPGYEARGLSVALDPEAMAPYLEACLAPDGPGGDGIGCSTVEVLSGKPGRRWILRYQLVAGDGSRSSTPRSVVAKLYGDGNKGRHVFALMRELTDRGFGPDADDGVRAPQAYAYVDELGMLLMEDVGGVRLSNLLLSPGLRDHVSAAGRALAKLHRCPPPPNVHRKTMPGRLASLRRKVAEACQVRPELTQALEARLESVSRLAEEPPPDELVLVHGGCHLREVLVDDDRVSIVDLDTLCAADPALDVGNFLADLRWKGLRAGLDECPVKSHMETFLRAYDPPVDAGLTRRIEFYRRAFLLRRACRLALRPRVQHLALPLLRETGE